MDRDDDIPPVLGPSDDPKGDLEKMFGGVLPRTFKKPFQLFFLVPERGVLENATMHTWDALAVAYRKFQDKEWVAPPKFSFELQVFAYIMEQVGLFKEK